MPFMKIQFYISKDMTFLVRMCVMLIRKVVLWVD